ncbi:WD repeat-containing and planar cell polarity effector protein fritz [Zootermopsis nevadensis]|uniref:WD repeat-containing protein C2orf86 n=1 Tax=Zootermopsis nevadensis TaxID=136037 RepID=A0A067QKD4_ZOONE|nr:WD repeat-containing and planar cell polarity effector protein fritz [Zootermopsis nevadensis]KDR08346.1 WD repeat-containing protein C2orf86 [Zootermopsis nevadensis]
MLTLLSQARFWTLKDEIIIKTTDFSSFRYHEKKDVTDSPYNESKRSYAEKRGMTWLLQNKRPTKLKDCVRDLEELLAHHKVVLLKWRDNCTLQIMLSSGMLINICINIFTGDILKIVFDKYLIGKLLSEYISDVIFTKTHLMCSYNDNQITLIYFTKPVIKYMPEKLSRLEPKLQVLELAGPSGRRLERKLSCNVPGDMVLIWWRCTRDEVYPWSPLVKDQDRANVHVYGINGTKAELLCFYRTEFDPVCVSFSQVQSNVIHSVEQKVSRKGEVTVESCTYEVNKSRLQRTSVTSIPLQTQVCCHGFSPDEQKLLLGCIDGSLVLFDEGRGITHLVKAAFISTMVSWHPDGTIVVVANERSQFQCYDIALACIKNQLISEDVTPSNLLDLASYFKNQPTLVQMEWSKKPHVPHYSENYVQTDGLLLLQFERGPLAVLRLVGGGGLRGDAYGTGLTPDVLVSQYLSVNQVDRAINLLLSLNWDSYGFICLSCLQRIANHLFRQPLTPEREVQLQTALGSFHVPLRPICHTTEVEFGDQVRNLTRRFFHHLLRYRLFEKAFRLAIDLNDHDLFMDIYFYARAMKEDAMAEAARVKAEQIVNRCSSRSTSETDSQRCSHSSCSGCSGSESSESRESSSDNEAEIPPQPPPLPSKSAVGLTHNSSLARQPGEKQKVKFCDTVTHILVPDLPPCLAEEEEFEPQNGPCSSNNTVIAIKPEREQPRHNFFVPDPKQELVDSLPLCLGNKDYLKDFATLPDASEEDDNGNGTIQIVNFGVV